MENFLSLLLLNACLAVGFIAPACAEDSIAWSTVEITRFSDQHIGAGVQIREGLIATAAHVVGTDPVVTITDSRGHSQIGIVEKVDYVNDIASVRISTLSRIRVSALFCVTPPIGTTALMIGHPFGHKFKVMRATVVTAAVHNIKPWPSLIIMSRDVYPGMSGGPVFIRHDEEIGVAGMVIANTFDPKRGYFAGVLPASVLCTLVDIAESPY